MTVFLLMKVVKITRTPHMRFMTVLQFEIQVYGTNSRNQINRK